jgi:uncharacterized spore protein YtfJ
MQVKLEEMLPQITDFLRKEANTDTVVGKTFQLGEFSCVPVIRVGLGFGTGLGEGEDAKKNHGEGGGAAGGIGVEPIGFLVSRGEQIMFLNTRGKSGLATAFEQLPELLNKYLEAQQPAMAN